MNFYETLGVNKTDDITTIKKAYKQLARKYHPDRNPGNDEYAEKFKEINGAYEVLSNPEKRSEYDMQSSRPFGGFGGFSSGRGAGTSPDFSDIFGDIFSQTMKRQKTQEHQAKNHFSQHEDLFKDIFDETAKRRSKSYENHQAKNHFSSSEDIFDDIYGQGKTKEIRQSLVLTKEQSKTGGTVDVYINEIKKTLKVNYPADSIPGRTLKIKHKDKEILLEIKWFSRKFKFDSENNVIITADFLKLTPGEKMKIKTVYDNEVYVSIPENVKIGSKLKLKGLGWQFKDGRKSDMFIKIA